jgi:tripartite ATP-independent transporter DctM subunit
VEVLLPFAVLVLLFVIGVPIAFSMAGAGMLGIYLLTGDWLTAAGLLAYRTAADFVLVTIPMFILMAYFTAAGGIARDLYTAAASFVGHWRGGLATASVFACGVFGALSGASVAAAAVITPIAMPNMRRFGYSDVLAAGALGVGATLDALIPPSVGMVLYAVITETSVGKLLIAGILPGIVLGILLAITIWVWVTINPTLAPSIPRVGWAQRWTSLRAVWPSSVLIFVVLYIMYSGIATPTEAGAFGALASALLGLATRRLSLLGALGAIKSTVRATAMIFLIIIGAKIFGHFLALSEIPKLAVDAVQAMELNRWVVVIAVAVGYFVISMFMDEGPLLLISLPVTFPLVMSMGFDPVWFGVYSILLACMGLVFPPVGLVSFVVSSTGHVELEKVFRGTSIMLIALIATTVLIMIFPQLALFLPSRMR